MGFRSEKRLMVRAPKGRTCPMPGNRLVTIGWEPVSVPNDRLVRRMIADGSLELVEKKKSVPAQEPVATQSASKTGRAKSKKGDS